MSSEFLDSFNDALLEMEEAFTEDWLYKGTSYPAISIDKMTFTSRQSLGGKFADATTQIFVREEIFQQSKVKKGSVVTARSQEFVIMEIDSEGDASRTLICGPAELDIWNK